MRIVTLNTWKNDGDYPRRLSLMAHGLTALMPDIVCLQECFAATDWDTAKHLANALGMKAFTRPSRLKARWHSGTNIDSTSGLAILCSLPVADECALILESDPADGERIAQRLDIVIGERRLRILNLHLTHLNGAGSADLRGRQLEQALRWAGEGLATGLLVAGDLNTTATAPELALLNTDSGFDQPTLHGAGIHARTYGGEAIDHLILQSAGDWRVVARFRALDHPDPDGWFPSDHAAVVVDLVSER